MDEVELNPPPAAKGKGHDVRAQDLRVVALREAVESSINGAQTADILRRAKEYEIYLLTGSPEAVVVQPSRQWAMGSAE